jgi:hypothetical protein
MTRQASNKSNTRAQKGFTLYQSDLLGTEDHTISRMTNSSKPETKKPEKKETR